MTCTSIDNLHNFTTLSNDMNLSTKVSLEYFETYINRIISSKNDYYIIPGNLF